MKHLATAALFALASILWLPGLAQAKGAAIGAQIDAKAVVESIDQSTRTVLLREENGDLETITVSPEVRNLAQVKAGDRVLTRIRLGVVAEMAPSDGSGEPVAKTDVAGRAQPGEKPGTFVRSAVRVRVTFDSYDPKTRTVDFTLPSGDQRTTVLRTKPMQDFAADLKNGDKVDVTFRRSVAVAVLPAG